MKYEKIIQVIQSGKKTREELEIIRVKALNKFKAGDDDASFIISAINAAQPKDSYVVFMGFCPGADFDNRLDAEWKKEGICRFDYLESVQQLERFNGICKGDLIVLKKREQFGKTMKLYGHGRVNSVEFDSNNIRYLKVDWSNQNQVIEVPLMACNSTVDIRQGKQVADNMPSEYFEWLEA
ncbi:TPA: hypothetical protein ACRZZI_005173 [Vibrio harveyi]